MCETAASGATACLDPAASVDSSYFVRPIVDGAEGDPSGAAPRLNQDYLRIPLRPASAGAFVHLGWVGDLDGDGEYDGVVDRISAEAPLVDAYTRRGEFLWRLDAGPLGADQNNVEGGAAPISNRHWDLDSDGFPELAIKTATGFVFGDGAVLLAARLETSLSPSSTAGPGRKWRGLPCLPISRTMALQCRFGVGYFDGVHPSVLAKCKNRVGSGAFNLVGAAYDFDGSSSTLRWRFTRDMGRNTVADLFPDQPGYEYWSFNGMFSAASGTFRLYTLVHDSAYRDSLAVHGYKQSHLVDYFQGYGMAARPRRASASSIGLEAAPRPPCPRGLMLGGGVRQLQVQLVGALLVGVFVFVVSSFTWWTLDLAGGIRVSAEAEEMGLDLAEMGMEAYPDDIPKPTLVTLRKAEARS